MAHVQIKGTKASGVDALRFRMKETTLNFLRSHADIAVIVRVQVEEKRYWMVHIHDARTREAPADDGYVTIHLTDEDEVAATDLAPRIDRLSYRKRLNAGWHFAIAVRPGDSALVLQSSLDGRLPRGLMFERENTESTASHQVLLQLPISTNETHGTLVDLATNRRSTVRLDNPGDAILDLASHFAQSGASRIAAQLFIRSPDLYTDAAIEALGVALGYILREACYAYCTHDEIASFVRTSVRTKQRWAGEWAINFAFFKACSLDPQMIEGVFACIPWTGFQLITLRARLYAVCGHQREGSAIIENTVPPADGAPETLFEFAQMALALGLADKARLAWKLAAKNGYDRFACHLEIACSFLSSGRFGDTIRFTPKNGTAKDARCAALMHLLTFLRSVFHKSFRRNPGLANVLSDNTNVALMLEDIVQGRIPAPPEVRPLFASALAIVLALRNEQQSSAETWGAALEWAIRAQLAPEQIDAIIVLSAPIHGGEPLRIAAHALTDPRQRAVLERWHLVAEQERGRQVRRRTEDFISKSNPKQNQK